MTRISRRRFLALSGSTLGAIALASLGASEAGIGDEFVSSQSDEVLSDYPPLPSERRLAPTVPVLKGGIAMANVFDPTSSTLADLVAHAKGLIANQVDSLVVPGQGDIYVFNNTVGRNSIDPRSSFLPFKVPATPNQPGRGETKARPAAPDAAACDSKTFGKQRCIDEVNAAYAAAMGEVIEDERAVQNEYLRALEEYDVQLSQHRASARVRTDELRAYELATTDVGSDIMGAFLVAGANLSTVRHRVERLHLFCQSDLEPYGKQSEGELDLQSVHVTILNWDVSDAVRGRELAQQWDTRLRTAGAISIRFLTPAQTSVADLLEV